MECCAYWKSPSYSVLDACGPIQCRSTQIKNANVASMGVRPTRETIIRERHSGLLIDRVLCTGWRRLNGLMRMSGRDLGRKSQREKGEKSLRSRKSNQLNSLRIDGLSQHGMKCCGLNMTIAGRCTAAALAADLGLMSNLPCHWKKQNRRNFSSLRYGFPYSFLSKKSDFAVGTLLRYSNGSTPFKSKKFTVRMKNGMHLLRSMCPCMSGV